MTNDQKPYGDPQQWDEIPTAFMDQLIERLTNLGWAVDFVGDNSLGITLDGKATGLLAEVARCYTLYIQWSGHVSDFEYGIAPGPDDAGEIRLMRTLGADNGDPESVAIQAHRILRTGTITGQTVGES